MRVLYAVTGHGWGHLTRSAALIDALLARRPDWQVTVSTALPEPLVRGAIAGPVHYRHAEYEPGASQHNCLDVDAQATAAAYLAFMGARDTRLSSEVAYLRQARIELVLSDIAALPIRAAATLGVPAMGVANFTWDWILEPLLAGTAAAHVPQLLADDYACGTRLFLLPFGQASAAFPTVTPAPVLARPSIHSRDQTLARLGLDPTDPRPLVLVCLGGWSGGDLPDIHVRMNGNGNVRFLAQRDLGIRFGGESITFDRELPAGLVFPDLVRAADAVVSKPGYGMASECHVQGTPVLFVERPGFRESPALLSELAARHPTRVLSREAFAGGHWEQALGELLALPRTAPRDPGAGTLAERLLALCQSE